MAFSGPSMRRHCSVRGSRYLTSATGSPGPASTQSGQSSAAKTGSQYPTDGATAASYAILRIGHLVIFVAVPGPG